jgi:hypothetical protein
VSVCVCADNGVVEAGPADEPPAAGADHVNAAVDADDGVDEESVPSPYDLPTAAAGYFSDTNWADRMATARASLSLWKVLAVCEDFAREGSIIATVIRERGHICVFAPKCHPELAGEGTLIRPRWIEAV